jgi:hypothetical membrane protein
MYQIAKITKAISLLAWEKGIKRLYPFLGILGPVIYIAAVVLGGALRHDYSPIVNTVSELTIPNAPNKTLLDILSAICNLLLFVLGISAYLDRRNTGRHYRTATLLLAAVGMLGLTLLFFPTNVPGSPPTLPGTIHMTIVGSISFLIISSVFLLWLYYRNQRRMKLFATYSYLSGIALLPSMAAAAVSIAVASHYAGLLERIAIGLFMQWVIGFSIFLFKSGRLATGARQKDNCLGQPTAR